MASVASAFVTAQTDVAAVEVAKVAARLLVLSVLLWVLLSACLSADVLSALKPAVREEQAQGTILRKLR